MIPIMNIIPRTTEKAYGLATGNVYAFTVPLASNKQQIVKAVEEQYNVKVKTVKTMVQTGKSVRFSRGKNRHPGTTTRRDSKKAYVTLVAGDRLTIFDTPESKETK
jgi:large subunit ribosomal protein L23